MPRGGSPGEVRVGQLRDQLRIAPALAGSAPTCAGATRRPGLAPSRLPRLSIEGTLAGALTEGSRAGGDHYVARARMYIPDRGMD